MKNIFLLIYLFVICLVISSCGQKGALVLPEKKFEIHEKNNDEKITNESKEKQQ